MSGLRSAARRQPDDVVNHRRRTGRQRRWSGSPRSCSDRRSRLTADQSSPTGTTRQSSVRRRPRPSRPRFLESTAARAPQCFVRPVVCQHRLRRLGDTTTRCGRVEHRVQRPLTTPSVSPSVPVGFQNPAAARDQPISGRGFVLADQAAEDRSTSNLAVNRLGDRRFWMGRTQLQRSMRTLRVCSARHMPGAPCADVARRR
jgi:hypothetical protein